MKSRRAFRQTMVMSLCVLIGILAVAIFSGRASAQPGGAARSPQAGTPRGKDLYDKHCVECHGPSGQGDGPAARILMPRPRDLTGGKYKIRSTESGSIPTDDDLLRAVRQGLQGTAMPAWDKLLSESEIGSVVAYIKTFSSRFASEPPQLIQIASKVTAAPGNPARGAQVYETLQCGKCHGTDGRGTGAVATQFEDDWRQPLRATDLTEPWIFRGGATPLDVFMRFRAGMSGSPMPSFKDAATDADMWDLAHYVMSLRRKPVWEMNADEKIGRASCRERV